MNTMMLKNRRNRNIISVGKILSTYVEVDYFRK